MASGRSVPDCDILAGNQSFVFWDPRRQQQGVDITSLAASLASNCCILESRPNSAMNIDK